MVNYGTKWLWCKIHMVRNYNFVVRNGKLWYEMVMVQNSYGTKWFLVMVRNCNFVVRNGKLWYEMTSFGQNIYWILTNMSIFAYLLIFIYVVCCLISSNVLFI